MTTQYQLPCIHLYKYNGNSYASSNVDTKVTTRQTFKSKSDKDWGKSVYVEFSHLIQDDLRSQIAKNKVQLAHSTINKIRKLVHSNNSKHMDKTNMTGVYRI